MSEIWAIISPSMSPSQIEVKDNDVSPLMRKKVKLQVDPPIVFLTMKTIRKREREKKTTIKKCYNIYT